MLFSFNSIIMNKLFDLRFVIGLFFSVVGILVFGYGFLASKNDLQEVNRWCGAIFIGFGIVMIVLSYQKSPLDKGNSE